MRIPIGVSLDGYFRCDKGATAYSVPYARTAKLEDPDWSMYPYCEAARSTGYIGPDGKVAPCMGFSDTALKEQFPSVLETPLAKLTYSGFGFEVANTRISKFLEKNPECAECDKLMVCHGGCMLADITDDGDYLVPDKRCCYFHKHIGEDEVRKVADEAIAATGLQPNIKVREESVRILTVCDEEEPSVE